MKIIKHIGIIIAGVLLLLGIPFWCAGGLRLLFSADVDAVTSASIILDKPSGHYYVLINKAMHTDEDNLADWLVFFSGGEFLYVFEDVSCSVAYGDPGAIALADSFRSQLPEHQMQAKREDGTLMLSRAEHGLYDIMIVSAEFADAMGVNTEPDEMTEVVEVFYETPEEEPKEDDENIAAEIASSGFRSQPAFAVFQRRVS